MQDITLGTIYEDVAELQARVTELENQVIALTPNDSGWVNFELENGVVAYSATQTPRYRKIGNKVYLKGAVKNVLASVTIATLPEGFRPNTSGHNFVQITSNSNGANFARWVVETSGAVRVETVSHNASYGAEKWFPIQTEFLND